MTRESRELCKAGADIEMVSVARGSASNDALHTWWRRISRQGAAITKTIQSAGLAVAVMPFPGLGAAAPNGASGIPTIRRSAAQAWRQDAAISAQIVAGVRVAIVSTAVFPERDPARPAALSSTVYDELRARGFRGVAMTADLSVPGLAFHGPAAGVLGLTAGADLLVRSRGDGLAQWRSIVRAVRTGSLRASRLRGAARRVAQLTRHGCR